VRVVDHLNLSTGNLGGNLQGLEETGLTGIATGGTLGNDNIVGGSGTDLGGGGAGVGLQDFTDLAEIAIGEDKSDVSTAASDELFAWRSGVFLAVLLEDLSHHGVLSHQDFGFSTKGLSGVLELLGTDIVNLNDEELGVGAQHVLEGIEILGFAFGGKRHGEGVVVIAYLLLTVVLTKGWRTLKIYKTSTI